MGPLKEKAVTAFANKLAKEGQRIVMSAYVDADFNKNKTQNLHDSYGSAVFYDGRLLPYTVYIPTSRAIEKKVDTTTGEVLNGRTAIEDFLRTYSAKPKSFELVCVAAIFYAKHLEYAQGGVKKKYRVITKAFSDLTQLSALYKNSSVHIIKDGKRQ